MVWLCLYSTTNFIPKIINLLLISDMITCSGSEKAVVMSKLKLDTNTHL